MVDHLFEALADRHRRQLCIALLENETRSEILAPEDAHVGETELEVFRIEMTHKHLPKLVDAGFIRWDREANEISKGPNFEEMRPFLKLMDEHSEQLPGTWP